jgi:hypothetical protein
LQVPLDINREKTHEDWTITSKKDRTESFGQWDHVRWYGQDYVTRLKNAGFKVNVINFVEENFSEEEIAKYGLMINEKIYHVEK